MVGVQGIERRATLRECIDTAVMLMAVALGLLGHVHPWLVVTAIALVRAAMAWAVLVLIVMLLTGVVRAWHSVERTPDSRAHATGPLLAEHWSMSLFHVGDAADAAALMAAVRSRIAELDADLLGPARRPGGAEIVLCQLDGVTSDPAERAVVALPDAVVLTSTRPQLLALGDAEAMAPAKPVSFPAHGIFLLLAGAQEASGCATACRSPRHSSRVRRSSCTLMRSVVSGRGRPSLPASRRRCRSTPAPTTPPTRSTGLAGRRP